jgi:predicted nucleic acid-binding protein
MNLDESFTTIERTENEVVETFFFDTYAFFEIFQGGNAYAKYESAKVITTKLNLFELYLGVLREHDEESAKKALEKYYPFVKEFDQEVIKAAAQLKKTLNKRDVSMTDCIGYCFAKQLGIKFLTGDSAFEHMDNIEFVP